MKKKYDYLFLLVIAMVLSVFAGEEIGFLLSVLFFIYTAIPSLILYYLFYIKKVKFNLRFMVLMFFGYSWATITSFLIKDFYINIAIFTGISIGVLASLIYHLYKNRKNTIQSSK